MSDEFQKRAERAIIEGTNEIMKAAQRRIALEKSGKPELGKWKITLYGSVDRTSRELKEFFDYLEEFSDECGKKYPKFSFKVESLPRED